MLEGVLRSRLPSTSSPKTLRDIHTYLDLLAGYEGRREERRRRSWGGGGWMCVCGCGWMWGGGWMGGCLWVGG